MHIGKWDVDLSWLTHDPARETGPDSNEDYSLAEKGRVIADGLRRMWEGDDSTQPPRVSELATWPENNFQTRQQNHRT